MPFKYCPDCRHLSFCACGSVIWICPCCGQDLSAVTASPDPERAAPPRRTAVDLSTGPQLFVVGAPPANSKV